MLQQWSNHGHTQTYVSNRSHDHLAAESIGHCIRLPWVINDFTIIILHHIQPSTLPHVQIRLIHQVPLALLIYVNSKIDPIEVMPPNLEGENHSLQLQIMRRIIRLMRLQLPQSVSDHATSLHQYFPLNGDQSILINQKIINTL